MRSKLGRTFALLLLLAAMILVTVRAFAWGFQYVVGQNARLRRLSLLAEERGGSLVDEQSPEAIQVFIPRSADMDDISDLLFEKKLIDNRFVFKLLSKFNGFDGQYQAGTHYLLPQMTYDELMFVLTRRPKPLTITFPEGSSYRQIKAILKEAGINFDERHMDELVRRPNAFLDYSFVRSLGYDERREWTLQGYLWPDTYLIDPNLDEESILRMFLNNTEKKLADSNYPERAASMGLSLDQAISLASIVQKEASLHEMSRVGRVFLNRINAQMHLASCASINYLREEEGKDALLWAQQEDLQRYRENPYNSYAHAGLPPGPINNPGTIAIEGVLWPANEDNWPGASSYLYFCARGDGTNAFARDLSEHEANIVKYSGEWEAQTGERYINPVTGQTEPTP